ncbi:4Fe-4S binding protein [Malacoplasma iowae]|uniref:4Fe-4S dicluster domain protein n=3 Tax=Malacoplasma iowae TaxID=2116 RepID=A0A084U4D5_MALIO|nr:4Fe-4S binding protein [Malacoplasma iowae]VEU62814.1 Nitrogen fixation protein rnfB [Mycoplasmopsis fermentans]EGZ31153.1 indolepyruvate ferredoxin oxidoreductase, alpha subunit related protein [Malacoplasma iowae 695]KFB07821.1 4Fe-4S dicluster domain protein [Malacoplasma iowae DK-CPA]QHG90277.2 4Fe-4S binding protein [Malacoplasma iowae 695]WPL35881.1 4Fe-4S binding protein [Malacoplasma iowae]
MKTEERLLAVTDQNKCEGCKMCINVCPTNSIRIVNNKSIIDDTCIACGACVNICPKEAIDLKMVITKIDE